MATEDKEPIEPLIIPPTEKVPEVKVPKLEDPGTIDNASKFYTLTAKVAPWSLGLAGFITRSIKDSFKEYLFDPIGKFFHDMVNRDYELAEYQKDLLLNKLELSEDWVTWLMNIKRVFPPAMWVAYWLIVAFGLSIRLAAELTIQKNLLSQELNKDSPSYLPDPPTLIAAMLKENLPEHDANELLDKLGLSQVAKQAYLGSYKQIADISTSFQNLWRGNIDEAQFTQQLKRMGYDEDQQSLFHGIVNRIPPIQDLIRFSVREAFSDELSALFGHDEEFPEDVGKWAQKQGFDVYWARMYWRAHWELPSVSQAFEMFHRRIITKEQVEALLKMQDYPVGWRESLLEMSYKVITRVDARRMYALGVWDNLPDMTPEEKVKDVYMDMGYSPPDAEYMKEFTINYTLEQRRGYTVAGLKRLFRYGLIDEPELREKMETMRFKEADIMLAIDEVNYQMDGERLDAFISMAKAKYLNGFWSDSDVITEINKTDVNIVNPEKLFEEWNFEREGMRKIPSRTDVTKWMTKGIIKDYKTAIKMILELGYDEVSANAYVEEAIIEMGGNLNRLVAIGYLTTQNDAYNHLMDIGFAAENAADVIERYKADGGSF